ncbi:SPX domain-containing protein [Mycena polygramma]|nr:SPX domain-containing protein [Mycena polygramma]
MKFTRYLEDTQPVEWKRAYIDYRIFKDRIRAIRQDGGAFPFNDSNSNSQLNNRAGSPSMLSVIVQSESGENSSETSSVHLTTEKRDLPFLSHPNSRGRAEGPSRPLPERRLTPPSPGGVAVTNRRSPKIIPPQLIVRQPTDHSSLAPASPVADTATLNSRRGRKNLPLLLTRQTTNTSHARQGDLVPPSPAVSPSSPASRVMKGLSQLMYSARRHPYSELSLQALIPLLSPQELAFFSALDSELQKVEAFYLSREKEMKERTRSLQAQLRELNEHRKLFDAAHPTTPLPWRALLNPTRFIGYSRKLPIRTTHMENTGGIPFEGPVDTPSAVKKEEDKIAPFPEHLDPKAYLYARRKLKKAVLEHYRGLEMLHNYRILNIYGFRRVLNKFEKATKIPAQRTYMEEKVVKCAFYSDEILRDMMDEMQNIFAESFGRQKTGGNAFTCWAASQVAP